MTREAAILQKKSPWIICSALELIREVVVHLECPGQPAGTPVRDGRWGVGSGKGFRTKSADAMDVLQQRF